MRVAFLFLFLIAAFSLAACDSKPARKTETAKPASTAPSSAPASEPASDANETPLGQLPTGVEPLHYNIDLTINPDQLRYEGTVEIDVDLQAPKREIFIHGSELTVSKIAAVLSNHQSIKGSYTQVHDSGVAKLSFEQQIPAGKVRLVLPFSAAFETAPDALTAISDNGFKYVWTQFEEISARRAFPCFDEPRFKTPFDISVTTIGRNAVISNTLPVSQEQTAEGVTKTVFATTAPLPTYLLALAVGPYEIVSGPTIPPSKVRAYELPLRAVTVIGKSQLAAHALKNTPPLVRSLEDYFAAPFPYPKLDLIAPPNFVAGGMENAGAITYTERGILLGPNPNVNQRRYYSLLHAHEVAHQWFGDLVTPKWWNDIWLNEAFASWLGNKIAASTWPEEQLDRETARDALAVMDTDALSSARSIRQPIKSNDDIFNAFDGLTYDKGAAVLQMFERYQGEESFREGVRLHMRRFAHNTATTVDFLASLTEASKKPEIARAMETFLDQPGLPLIRVDTKCNGKDLDVVVTQTPFGATNKNDARKWTLPVCMREMARGRPLPCTLMDAKPAMFTVRKLCGAPLMPNANASGYYRFTMSAENWRALAQTVSAMPPAEQLATLHAMRAAFRTGDVDARTYTATLRNVISTGEWDVVEAATDFLIELRDNFLADARRPEFEQVMRKWFDKPLQKFGTVSRPGERASKSLARVSLANLATKVTKDPSALSAFSNSGIAILNAMNGSKPFAMDELSEVYIWAAIQTGEADVAQKAIEALRNSHDAENRSVLIRALAAAKHPKAQATIREFVLSGGLKVRETFSYLRTAFENAETRDGTWNWLKKHFNSFAKIGGPASGSRLVSIPSQLCSQAAAKDVEAFFKPLVKKISGAPRKLANTLEAINNCAAWKARHQKQVEDAIFIAAK